MRLWYVRSNHMREVARGGVGPWCCDGRMRGLDFFGGPNGLLAHGLSLAVQRLLDSWTPSDEEPLMDLPQYVELAYARQCLHLARTAQDSSSTELYELVVELERSLAVLEDAHPCFVYPHSAAIAAVELAGEMLVDDTMDALCEVNASLPEPVTAPVYEGKYVVVDDEQSEADFERTRLPDRAAFNIFIAEDLHPNEFERDRRVVFTTDMFTACVPDFVADRLLTEGTLRFTLSLNDDCTYTPWFLLRDLRRVIDSYLARSNRTFELPAVEYYTELAFATSCAETIMRNPMVRNNLNLLHPLLSNIVGSLTTALRRNPELDLALALAREAADSCSRLDHVEAVNLAVAVVHLLPENYRRRLPRDWELANHEDAVNAIYARLLDELPAAVCVKDWNAGDLSEFSPLPQRLLLSVAPDVTLPSARTLWEVPCSIFARLEDQPTPG